ncbi:metal-sensitive transcriptional regulator [Streptomyces sp. NPDC058469]|uniref:metal-sensitive transcriptional regulator n=1 Tax=Streptomyces sp. NPDC058469 TaxID=3346514 RepID=UPI0036687824
MTTTEAGAAAAPSEPTRESTREPVQESAQEPVTHGYHHQKDEHLKRLRRIEGQVRGLQRMVDEDVYCIDILTQVSASTKALQSFALQLLEEHLRHCVADAAVKGGEEIDAKVDEATKAIARLLRT